MGGDLYFGYTGAGGRAVGPDVNAKKLGRETMVWESDPSAMQAKTDATKLDLCNQNIKSLDLDVAKAKPGAVHKKLETLYLRTNEISSLAPLHHFPLSVLKVLDLSFNELRADELQYLSATPSVKQLYLSGNRLRTLEKLPVMPVMDILVASNCNLASLKMTVQPELMMLCVNDNRLEGFKGLPCHPKLEVLQMSENLKLKGRDRLDTAAVLICGEQLSKFAGKTDKMEPITMKVLEDAKTFPAYAVNFLKMGWLLPSDAELEEHPALHTLANNYLCQVQAKSCVPVPEFELAEIKVDAAACGVPVHAVFSLSNAAKSKDLTGLKHTYQWYRTNKDLAENNWQPLEGATAPMYIPLESDIGYMLKVVLDVDEPGFKPIHGLTDHVVLGTRMPKCTVTLDGKPMEGEVLQAGVTVVWCKTVPGEGTWQWWKIQEDGTEEEQIAGQDGDTFTLTVKENGYLVSARYAAVSAEGVASVPASASTILVEQHPPTARGLEIAGECKGGHVVEAVPTYFGGIEGESEFQWFRTSPDAKTAQSKWYKIQGGNVPMLELTPNEVGCFLKVEYTPVCETGERGDTVVATVPARIPEGIPVVSDLAIKGTLVEGEVVRVEALYSGGIEGASRIEWFGVHGDDLTPLPSDGESKSLVLPLAATNGFLEVHYTPQRTTGEEGSTKIFRLEKMVEMGHPTVLELHVAGVPAEGEELEVQYMYQGGHEGKSRLQWIRCPERAVGVEHGVTIKDATGPRYTVTLADVGYSLWARVVPVRQDGEMGSGRVEPLWADASDESNTMPATITLALPKVASLRIGGEPVEGERVTAIAVYFGEADHSFKFQWYRREPGFEPLELIEGATKAGLTVTVNDIGYELVVQCTPVREDGVLGSPAVEATAVAEAAAPTITQLKVVGDPVEGEELAVDGEYFGGELSELLVVWKRERCYPGTHQVESSEVVMTSQTLTLSLADVGCTMVACVTPVRSDGMRGVEGVARTASTIAPTEPRGVSFTLPPTATADRPVVPTAEYIGGKQLKRVMEWYCVPEEALDTPAAEMANTYQVVAKDHSFTPAEYDLDYDYLVVVWTPARDDGIVGAPLAAHTRIVQRGPEVEDVMVEEIEVNSSTGLPLFQGMGTYAGGVEGKSSFSWYRVEDEPGAKPVFIIDANCTDISEAKYQATAADYGYSIVFAYTPRRQDGEEGVTVFSEPSDGVILPPAPQVKELRIEGPMEELEPLQAVAYVLPKQLPGGPPPPKLSFLWKRAKSKYPPGGQAAEMIGAEHSPDDPGVLSSTNGYTPNATDVDTQLVCIVKATDLYGRTSSVATCISAPIKAGKPRVSELTIGWHPNLHNTAARPIFKGTPYHTCRFVAAGKYAGGVEGESVVKWSRRVVVPQGQSVARTGMDLVVASEKSTSSFNACIDDVGFVLIAEYTPVRSDGVKAAKPECVESQVIQADPEVEKEVLEACRQEEVKFDIIMEGVKSAAKNPGETNRVLNISKKRVKIVKPGKLMTKTEARGEYGPGSSVQANRNDPRKMVITIVDPKNKPQFTTQRQRDVAVQVLRRFAGPDRR